MFCLAVDMIKQHEGFSRFAYKCPVGKITVGYGRNIDNNILMMDTATPSSAILLKISSFTWPVIPGCWAPFPAGVCE